MDFEIQFDWLLFHVKYFDLLEEMTKIHKKSGVNLWENTWAAKSLRKHGRDFGSLKLKEIMEMTEREK